MPAKADSPRAPKNRSAAPDSRTSSANTHNLADVSAATRKSKIVATGGCSTLLTSSLAQAFDLVPAELQTEFHGTLVAVALIGVCYLVLPRKAKITLEWER